MSERFSRDSMIQINKQENVRNVALDTLLKIEKDGAYSNLVLNQVLNNCTLKEIDKGLLTELMYGTIQRRQTLDRVLADYINPRKTAPWLYMLLRMSLYQIMFLDRIPAHAVVNEAVEIAKKRSKGKLGSFVNGVLRNVLRNKETLLRADGSFLEQLAFQTAHPPWLVSYLMDAFGEEETKVICETNLQPPKQTLRINPLKTSKEKLIAQLEVEGFQVTPSANLEECLVNAFGSVAQTNAFDDGLFSIQDESSMLVAYAADPKEGMRILDCCAAPGGKSTHLAERMKGNGQIISQDIHAHKVKLIRKSAKRLGLKNIDAKEGDAKFLHEQYEPESFDIVLVDAPCSGLGVIRRKPEIKDEKTLEDLQHLQRVQLEILDSAANLVKPGGRLVYSTCTVGPLENTQVREMFMHRHIDFYPEEALHTRYPQEILDKRKQKMGELVILPQDLNSDGFYICSFVKEG